MWLLRKRHMIMQVSGERERPRFLGNEEWQLWEPHEPCMLFRTSGGQEGGGKEAAEGKPCSPPNSKYFCTDWPELCLLIQPSHCLFEGWKHQVSVKLGDEEAADLIPQEENPHSHSSFIRARKERQLSEFGFPLSMPGLQLEKVEQRWGKKHVFHLP